MRNGIVSTSCWRWLRGIIWVLTIQMIEMIWFSGSLWLSESLQQPRHVQVCVVAIQVHLAMLVDISWACQWESLHNWNSISRSQQCWTSVALKWADRLKIWWCNMHLRILSVSTCSLINFHSKTFRKNRSGNNFHLRVLYFHKGFWIY